MEPNQPLDSDFSPGLNINGDIRLFLKETAKWAQFIAIVGLVLMGSSILMMLSMGTLYGNLMQEFSGGSGFGGGIGMLGGFGMLLYTLFMALFIIPLLYLLRFARNTKAALKSDNQELMTSAFQNLKSHYKFYGIFLAIVVGFYAIMLVFGLIAGVGAAF